MRSERDSTNKSTMASSLYEAPSGNSISRNDIVVSLLNAFASEMMFQIDSTLTHQKIYDLEENTASTPDVVRV